MRVGRFITGVFRPVPTETYLALGAESVPHEVYELRAETAPMTAEKEAEVVSELLKIEVDGMEVLGVQAEGSKVKMQFTGSPFAWALLLAILPSIIVPLVAMVIGIIFMVRVPEWALALPFVGIGGGILLYALVKAKK